MGAYGRFSQEFCGERVGDEDGFCIGFVAADGDWFNCVGLKSDCALVDAEGGSYWTEVWVLQITVEGYDLAIIFVFLFSPS